jgi:beta-ketoacyl synthase-like protein
MRAFVQGVGVLAPGLEGFVASREILAGAQPYALTKIDAPSPQILPAAERRRTAGTVRYALCAAGEALAMSGAAVAEIASVFASSGGDGVILNQICEALAASDHAVSPTRFHNSVHNAAAGYWSIATGSRGASSSLCAYDATFGAALLDAMSQVVVERESVLLAVFDCALPEPIFALRRVAQSFAAAFVLTPERSAQTLAEWEVNMDEGSAAQAQGFPEEVLFNPAARALPLLVQLAKKEAGDVAIEYLPGQQLVVKCAC